MRIQSFEFSVEHGRYVYTVGYSIESSYEESDRAEGFWVTRVEPDISDAVEEVRWPDVPEEIKRHAHSIAYDSGFDGSKVVPVGWLKGQAVTETAEKPRCTWCNGTGRYGIKDATGTRFMRCTYCGAADEKDRERARQVG